MLEYDDTLKLSHCKYLTLFYLIVLHHIHFGYELKDGIKLVVNADKFYKKGMFLSVLFTQFCKIFDLGIIYVLSLVEVIINCVCNYSQELTTML